MGIIIYIFFYLGVLILGFFVVAPLIIASSFDERYPYIVLMVLGYPTLIGLLVYAHRKGYMRRSLFSKTKEEIRNEESIEVEPPEDMPEEQREDGGYIPE